MASKEHHWTTTTIIDNIEARKTEIIFKLPTLKHFVAHAMLSSVLPECIGVGEGG